MVAVGTLKNIWDDIPEYASEEEFTKEFNCFFNAECHEVLDSVEQSYDYNSYNIIYFSVENIETVENLDTGQLIKTDNMERMVNIVVS